MSHLACADAGADDANTQRQLRRFADMVQRLAAPGAEERAGEVAASLAASAGVMGLAGVGYRYVRPGIMLYGGSPLRGVAAEALGLRPVMTLCSRLIAVNVVRAGEAIGYGARYVCERDMRVGVVSFGYADGYPRAAGNGTPVLVMVGGGLKRSRVLGRVSMDSLTIDLSDIDAAGVGDAVVLWGAGLPCDEIAACAGTIAYDLLSGIGRRVVLEYQDGQ